jgi:hypothetical protein
MLYISFTMGKLNCPVVDLGSWKDWALVQDRSQVIQRQSGAVVWRERRFRLAEDLAIRSVVGFDPARRFARCGAA